MAELTLAEKVQKNLEYMGEHYSLVDWDSGGCNPRTVKLKAGKKITWSTIYPYPMEGYELSQSDVNTFCGGKYGDGVLCKKPPKEKADDETETADAAETETADAAATDQEGVTADGDSIPECPEGKEWDETAPGGGQCVEFIVAKVDRAPNPNKKIKTIEERAMDCQSFTPIVTEVDGEETVIVSEGCDMRPASTEFGAAGSVGIALDNIADEAFAHVGQAFVNLIENNIISVDVLMDALQQIPGSKLVSSLVKQLTDCPKPPLIAPPLNDIFKTTELDFCGENGFGAEITLPHFRSLKIGPFNDVGGILIGAFEDALEQLIFNLIKMSFKLVLDVLMNASCDTIADIASLAGGSNLKDALRNALCGPSANDAEVAKGIADILNALNSLGGVYPSEACMEEFIDKVGNTLTNEEVRDCLRGEPSPAALEYISEITQTQSNPCLSNMSKDELARMFGGLGNVLDGNILDAFLGTSPALAPFNPNICLDPNDLSEFANHRAAILASKGLSPEEVDYQNAQALGRKKRTLDDLNNLLAGLGEISLPPLISDNPACPEEGLLPAVDPATAAAVTEAYGDMYSNINIVFFGDLVTRKGLLNMILSDVRGTGYRWHTNFFIRYFGEPQSSDLGYFQWFANGIDGKRKHDVIPSGGDPILGIFPDTVASYLQKALRGKSISDGGNEIEGGFVPIFESKPNPQEYQGLRIKLSDLELYYAGYEIVAGKDNPFSSKPMQYYFDINYRHFVLDENGNPKWDNECHVVVNNLYDEAISFRSVFEISTGSQDYIDSLYTEPGLFSGNPELPTDTGDDYEYEGHAKAFGPETQYHDKTVEPSLEYGAVQSSETIKYPALQKSPQATVFGKIIQDTWTTATDPTIAQLISHYGEDELFNYIQSAILKKFAIKVSNNARAWDFGFDATIDPKIVLLDDYEQYGGNADMPPFYLETPQYGGWLGIYDALVPEVDACDRKPIIDFNDISQTVNELNDKYKDDPRLESNPDCVIEPPYQRILEKGAAANIEGAIIAMCRIYIVENFIKGMPVFSLFEAKFPEVFNDILVGYIVEKMNEDLQTLGGNVFLRPDIKKHTFYYTFLEQVVQNYGRKVAIDPDAGTAEEDAALAAINEITANYTEPSAPRKKIKKRRRFDKYMSATKDYAKVFLKRYVATEMEKVATSFKEALNPAIHDLSSLVLGSPDWMWGALTDGGPLDVPNSDMADTLTEQLGFEDVVLASSLKDYMMTNDLFKGGGGYFPFVLEKYIKIEDYEGRDPPGNFFRADRLNESTITGEPVNPDLRGVVNIAEWKTFLSSHTWEGPHGESLSIGNLYKSWSFGLRISCVLPGVFSNTDTGQDIYRSISNDTAQATRSFKLAPGGEDPETTMASQSPEGITGRLIFPLVSTEIEFDPMSIISSGLMNTYDTTCMVNKMVKEPPYQTLFNYCFPLQSLLSLVTIYTIEGFLPSLGQEWEEEESPLTGNHYPSAGGKQGGKGMSQFNNWDKDTFEKTKKALRGIFRASYHLRDINYKDPESLSPSEEARNGLRVKFKFPKMKINGKSKRMPWWMRKLLRPKPLKACAMEEEDN